MLLGSLGRAAQAAMPNKKIILPMMLDMTADLIVEVQ